MIAPASGWKAIPGFEGAYEAHPDGFVRSVDRVVHSTPSRGRPYTRRYAGQVLSPSIANDYPVVTLWDQGSPTHRKVANLVALTFHGPKPAGLYACHRDGDRSNSCASNIYYGTPEENVADARRHGTLAVGERAGSARLTVEAVRYMRQNPDSLTQAALGARFGVGQGRVSRIRAGKQWKDVA